MTKRFKDIPGFSDGRRGGFPDDQPLEVACRVCSCLGNQRPGDLTLIDHPGRYFPCREADFSLR